MLGLIQITCRFYPSVSVLVKFLLGKELIEVRDSALCDVLIRILDVRNCL